MSVMTITKIEFGTLPVSILETYPILMYFCKMFANIFYFARFLLLTLLVAAGSNPSKTFTEDATRPEDWQTYFEYTANKQLLADI